MIQIIEEFHHKNHSIQHMNFFLSIFILSHVKHSLTTNDRFSSHFARLVATVLRSRARIESTLVGSIRLYFEKYGSSSVPFDFILKNMVRVRFGSTLF